MWPSRSRLALVAATAASLTLAGCSGSSGAAAPSETQGHTVPAAPSSTAPGHPTASGAHGSSQAATGRTTDHSVRPGSVTIAVSGDEIAHPAVLAAARRGIHWDFSPMFAQIAPVIRSADVAICQLETPVGVTGAGLSHGFTMGAPTKFADDLQAAGYDGCSTANNHTFDQGLAGMRKSRTVLTAVGLKAAGPGPDKDHPGQPVFYKAGGFTIASLAYSYTLDNTVGDSKHVPGVAPWSAKNLYAVIGPSGIESDARAARAQGADLVLVSMHWGEEQDQRPSDEQRRFAKELLSSGTVDYIIGNHPHVVQPCQRINGRMVNYSLGNALSDQTAGIVAYGGRTSTQAAQDGMIALVTFHRDAAGHITSSETFQPTRVDRAHGYVIRPVTKTSDPASWHRTTSVVMSGGNSCGAKPVG